MKKLIKITLIALALLPVLGYSQSDDVAAIFQKYDEVDGFTSINVSKGLFELFAEIEADDPEFDDFKKAVEGLESLKLLAYSLEEGEGDEATRQKFVDDMKNSISFDGYEKLMVVRDSDANIDFYAISDKQIIKEMVMVVDGKDEAVLLSLYGNLDLNYVAKLGKGMNIGGMEHLHKMDND